MKFQDAFDKVRRFFPKMPLLEKVLSEPDGTPSYGRYSGFLIIVSTLLWVTYVVIKTGSLPDLAGPTTFITFGSGTHYGINQAKKVVAAMRGTPEESQEPPQGGPSV